MYIIIASVKQYCLGENHLHNNSQVKIPSRMGYFQDDIKVSGDFLMPIHTMLDTREKWQRQTCKDTTVARNGPEAETLQAWPILDSPVRAYLPSGLIP